ncbi:MAG: hypothetical protein KQH53_08980 [Desulfarculaceae bacterium]|nr:hypothetical protein [Desulfarculaceae bacterium]
MAAFQRYIGVDYSGARTPDSRQSGLRVYLAEGDDDPEEVRTPTNPAWNWTRRELANWLLGQLREEGPTLVGIDHAFSFPGQYFVKYGLKSDWGSFLQDFHQYWPSDQEGAVVSKLKDTAGLGKERAGEATWRRETEKRNKAKSVFHFNVTGTVANSTHAGLPWLLHLRRELGNRVFFWPFDGWLPTPGVSTVAEVYPALWKEFSPPGKFLDHQRDAYAVAKWMQQKDLDGDLPNFFRTNLTPGQRQMAEVEGWILGEL